MKARSIPIALAVAASLAAFSPATVIAEAPAPVVINLHPCTFAPVELGPWEASGAINDSGSYVRTDTFVSPPLQRQPFGLGTGPLHEEFVFTSSRGTFTVNAEELIAETGQRGVWQISAGTGAYADTSGHGGGVAFFFTPTPNSCSFGFQNFTFALTGVASKVG
jgi:hypothetical protein